MGLPSRNWRTFIVIAFLTAVALGLRLVLALKGGFWRDEALFVGIVELPTWSSMLDFLRTSESHPPLFYAVMRVWMAVAGKSQLAITLLPTLLGAALVPLVFVVGRSLFSLRVGFAGAAFVALAPQLTFYSSLARPYSLLPFLVVCSSYFLARALIGGGARSWAGLGVSLYLTLLTHNWGLVILAGHLLAVSYAAFRRPECRGSLMRAGAITLLAVSTAYLPWVEALMHQVETAGYGAMQPINFTQVGQMLGFVLLLLAHATIAPYVDVQFEVFLTACLVLACVVAAAGTVYFLHGKRDARSRIRSNASAGLRPPSPANWCAFGVMPVASLCVAFALSFRSNLLVERCVVMLAPPLIIYGVDYAERQWKRVGRQRGRFSIAAGLFLVLSGAQAAGLASLYERPRSNARELAALVDARTNGDDFLIVAPVWLASSFNYYSRSLSPQFDFPDRGRRSVVSFSGLRQRLADNNAWSELRAEIRRAKVEGRAIWLITDMEYRQQLAPRKVSPARGGDRLEQLANWRVAQIGAELERNVGPGWDTVQTSERASLENLYAIRFGPRGH